MANEKPLLKFKIPKVESVEGYAVRKPDGTIVVRTKDELTTVKKTGGTSESREKSTS